MIPPAQPSAALPTSLNSSLPEHLRPPEPQLPNSIAHKLDYQIPRLRLCLIQQNFNPHSFFQITSPLDAAKFLEPLFHYPEEHFVSIHLNTRHEVLGIHEVSHGTLNSSLVHPREVFKAAIVANSYAIIVCHNHPSGSLLKPSLEDLEVTKQLVKAGDLLGVRLIDHLIFGPFQKVYSLHERHPELWNSS
jgi:DNA repair protein RadC